ncbi:MAG: hypothetical protein WCJ09_04325 [Planctomycetota bacterium]
MIRLVVCGLDESRIDEIARRIRGASVTRLPDLPAGEVAGVECDAVACFGTVPPDVRFIANTIQAGRHMFIATDVLPSLADLKSLIEQANSRGVHIQIENSDHGLPSRRLIFNELRGSKLGQFGLIRSHRWESTPGLRTVDSFHLPAPLVRDLELMLWLTDQTPTVVFAVERSAQQGDTRGTIHVHLGFAGGGMALMDYADCLLPGDGYQSLSTICANGAMYVDDHANRQLAYLGGIAQATSTDEGLLPFVTLIQQFVTGLGAHSPMESGLARWEQTCALAATVRQSLDRRSPVAFDSQVHSPDQALQGSV